MIIVADSGSTKTEWQLCSTEGLVKATQTGGLNPLALDKASTIAELRNSELNGWLNQGIERVYFYGAGVVDAKLQQIVAGNLEQLFTKAKIEVNSDLLGAARAAFGDDQGIVGIIGTGSNSGFFNGHEISQQIPALGYILADEGSGSVLGRTLIKHFLRNELPDALSLAFKDYYPQYDRIIETIYAQKHAARFLASFVPFIYDHKEDEFVREFLLQELRKFVNLLSKYQGEHRIGLVGSVGFQFQAEINFIAKSAGLRIVDYIKNPIDKLAIYHQRKIL